MEDGSNPLAFKSPCPPECRCSPSAPNRQHSPASPSATARVPEDRFRSAPDDAAVVGRRAQSPACARRERRRDACLRFWLHGLAEPLEDPLHQARAAPVRDVCSFRLKSPEMAAAMLVEQHQGRRLFRHSD